MNQRAFVLRPLATFITLLLGLTILLACGCFPRNYYLPSDMDQHEPIPDSFLKDLGDGWSYMNVRMSRRYDLGDSYQDLLSLPRFITIQRPGQTAGVLSANNRFMWFIPAGTFKSPGLGQINIREQTATLLTEDNVSLPDKGVQSVHAKSDGTVWIATSNGAMNYNPETWMGKTFDDWWTFDQKGGGLQRNWGLFTTTPKVYDILEKGNFTLFLAGDLYAFHKKKQSWNRYHATTSHTPMDTIERHFTVERIYIERKKGKKDKRHKYRVKIHSLLHLYAMQPRDGGLLDVTTYGGALSKDRGFLLSHNGITEIDFANKRWRHHVRKHSQAGMETTCRKRHKKWGVCLQEDWEATRYTWQQTANLPDVMASCVAIDDDGTGWFGFRGMTRGEGHEGGRPGLATYDGSTWRRITGTPASNLPVTDLHFAQNGDLFVGTEYGLYQRSDDRWYRITIPGVQSKDFFVLDVEVAAGVLWVATPGGIFSKRFYENQTPEEPPEKTGSGAEAAPGG